MTWPERFNWQSTTRIGFTGRPCAALWPLGAPGSRLSRRPREAGIYAGGRGMRTGTNGAAAGASAASRWALFNQQSPATRLTDII